MNTKLLFFLPALLCITGLQAKSHPIMAKENQANVELSFKLKDHGKKIGDYYVLIYCDTNAADTFFVHKGKVAYLDLDYNKDYTIRYEKEGYKDRVVIVHTSIEKKGPLKDMKFDYEIELIKENEPGNTLADLPVAVIRYDKCKKRFDYSKKYNRQVRHFNP
ncbi:hypothetical protein BH09BAC5_BH09BAC5_01890 [soil metagenome]